MEIVRDPRRVRWGWKAEPGGGFPSLDDAVAVAAEKEGEGV